MKAWHIILKKILSYGILASILLLPILSFSHTHKDAKTESNHCSLCQISHNFSKLNSPKNFSLKHVPSHARTLELAPEKVFVIFFISALPIRGPPLFS